MGRHKLALENAHTFAALREVLGTDYNRVREIGRELICHPDPYSFDSHQYESRYGVVAVGKDQSVTKRGHSHTLAAAVVRAAAAPAVPSSG